jgi:hypothetical protein
MGCTRVTRGCVVRCRYTSSDTSTPTRIANLEADRQRRDERHHER